MESQLDTVEISFLSQLVTQEIKEFNSELFSHPDQLLKLLLIIKQKLDLQFQLELSNLNHKERNKKETIYFESHNLFMDFFINK